MDPRVCASASLPLRPWMTKSRWCEVRFSQQKTDVSLLLTSVI